MSKDYYVYIYFDQRQGKNEFIYDDLQFDHKPFYVGKGKGSRFREHLLESRMERDRNSYKCRTIRKILKTGEEPIILKYKENLTDQEALMLEEELIGKIGRRCDGGPLTNFASKGCVMSGKAHPLFGKPRSLETRKKISLGLTGLKKSKASKEKQRKNMLGKPKSKEHSANISKGKKGIATVSHTPESKEKIASAQRGKKHHSARLTIFIKPNGERIEITHNFEKFLNNNNLTHTTVRKWINKGKIPSPIGLVPRYGQPRLNLTDWEIIVPSLLETKED